jgi:DNA modification methylase
VSDYIGKVFSKSCADMSEIPDDVIQCCVCSPPYYGLRDYGIEGQIGLEPTVGEYVERLVGVFREVRRVLRDDGTLWLNLGDSYASMGGAGGTMSASGLVGGTKAQRPRPEAGNPEVWGRWNKPWKAMGLKPKDLIGVPWMVAFALRADGWWLRDAIVWHKPNPMPSSVEDRCTASYEFVFMLAKSARYYADMESVREPGPPVSPREFGRKDPATHGREKLTGNMVPGKTWQSDGGANLRNVWTIATTPYAEAHFATFPIELPSRCIRIGSRPGDLVLDPFAGSGTTFEAAEALGRKWVGYELNPAYHALIAERTRQQGLLT